ncbi:hypothetical protein AABE10_33155 [Paraburkholderia diazotrophica]
MSKPDIQVVAARVAHTIAPLPRCAHGHMSFNALTPVSSRRLFLQESSRFPPSPCERARDPVAYASPEMLENFQGKSRRKYDRGAPFADARDFLVVSR